MLCEEKIETPATYFAGQGRGVWKSKEDIPRPYSWNGFAVGQILSKPEIGPYGQLPHPQGVLQGQTGRCPLTGGLADFENTHEAIVDKATWELAQKLRKTPCRHDTIGEANPLTGLLYCADCGAKLYNHRSRGTPAKPYSSDWFNCSTYTLARQYHDSACSNHHISTKGSADADPGGDPGCQHLCHLQRGGVCPKVRAASEVRQAQAERLETQIEQRQAAL